MCAVPWRAGVPLSTVQELASSHGWTVDIETGTYRRSFVSMSSTYPSHGCTGTGMEAGRGASDTTQAEMHTDAEMNTDTGTRTRTWTRTRTSPPARMTTQIRTYT
eukprot:1138770-Pleurochrysis_carterae.AAC.2